MAYWLLQANPETWDIFGAVAANEPIETWTVARYGCASLILE